MDLEGTLIGGKWKVGRVIGSGACGSVYLATEKSNENNQNWVIKIVSLPKNSKDKDQRRIADTLFYEHVLYQGHFNDFPFRPLTPPGYYGEDTKLGIRYMVMEKLDSEITSLISTHHRNQDIANVGISMTQGLQWIHKKGYLFIDIKPENFMLKDGKLVFIDYGLVESWKPASFYADRPPEFRQMAGTPTYCSLDAHNGRVPNRKDDLESMGYVLLFLYNGGILPWSNASSEKDLMERLTSCDIMEFSRSIHCPEIGEIITYARGLSATEAPNYDWIVEKLKSLSQRPDHKTNKKLNNQADDSTGKTTTTTTNRRKRGATTTPDDIVTVPPKKISKRIASNFDNVDSTANLTSDIVEEKSSNSNSNSRSSSSSRSGSRKTSASNKTPSKDVEENQRSYQTRSRKKVDDSLPLPFQQEKDKEEQPEDEDELVEHTPTSSPMNSRTMRRNVAPLRLSIGDYKSNINNNRSSKTSKVDTNLVHTPKKKAIMGAKETRKQNRRLSSPHSPSTSPFSQRKKA